MISKNSPYFFSSNNFQILWERNPLHLPLPYFFLENRTQLLLPAFSPQKNMNLVVKLDSLLVHHPPFMCIIYLKLATLIWHFVSKIDFENYMVTTYLTDTNQVLGLGSGIDSNGILLVRAWDFIWALSQGPGSEPPGITY